MINLIIVIMPCLTLCVFAGLFTVMNGWDNNIIWLLAFAAIMFPGYKYRKRKRIDGDNDYK